MVMAIAVPHPNYVSGKIRSTCTGNLRRDTILVRCSHKRVAVGQLLFPTPKLLTMEKQAHDGHSDPPLRLEGASPSMPAGNGEVPHMKTPGAVLVAAGILLSRLAGLVRLRVFAYYFGLQSDAADAFNAAFRIPNFLQNLFGEGALSASFIPVYASLLGRGSKEEADQVAGAVGAILALVAAVLVLAGLVATPLLIGALAPGFVGEKRELTMHIVRILFPGAGLLVLSAWCLGVLNSHRRFLLSYAAPIVWNAAMITTLWRFGGRSDLDDLAVMLAWGSVVGSALQFAIQIPVVLRVAPHLRCRLDATFVHVREVIRNFAPV